MKLYIVTTSKLNVREEPSSARDVAILGSLPRNAEFFSDKQLKPGKEETWARRVNEQGQPWGWLCISTIADRFCKELPLPTPPALPPTLPPMPEPPGGLYKMDEILDIVKRIEAKLKT